MTQPWDVTGISLIYEKDSIRQLVTLLSEANTCCVKVRGAKTLLVHLVAVGLG